MQQASKYREALGITQEEAAQLLKIPKSIRIANLRHSLNKKTSVVLILG